MVGGSGAEASDGDDTGGDDMAVDDSGVDSMPEIELDEDAVVVATIGTLVSMVVALMESEGSLRKKRGLSTKDGSVFCVLYRRDS